MTKEELLVHIKERLRVTEEIADFIPGLKKEKDPAGALYYTYNGIRIDDLDRDTLDKLFGRIQTESVRINTERINKQLESIRQAQQAQQAAQQAARIPAVVQVPPQPPKIPQAPPTQAQIPKVPQLPPQPPKK